MRFYTQQHAFYCGIDLHARTMYLCILDQDGEIVCCTVTCRDPGGVPARRSRPTEQDLVVAVECMFCLVLARRPVCRRKASPSSSAMPST